MPVVGITLALTLLAGTAALAIAPYRVGHYDETYGGDRSKD